MTSGADRYSYSVRQAEIDGSIEFEATVREFPDIIVYAESAEDALASARSLVSQSLEVLQEIGASIPLPIERITDYSGRITLRLPKWLHRSLSEVSEEEECSLNQHIVNLLIEQSTVSRARREVTWWHPPQRSTVKAPAKRSTHFLRVVKETHYSESPEWRKAK